MSGDRRHGISSKADPEAGDFLNKARYGTNQALLRRCPQPPQSPLEIGSPISLGRGALVPLQPKISLAGIMNGLTIKTRSPLLF